MSILYSYGGSSRSRRVYKKQLDGIEQYLNDLGYPHHALHAGPLIRREADYENMTMEERKKFFNIGLLSSNVGKHSDQNPE